MDDGDPSLSDEENDVEDSPDNLSRVRLVDAPILLFVCFHKALRSELDRLRGLAETASLQDDPRRRREIILKLQQRFQFLKLALKYHCAAEDEVSFSTVYISVISRDSLVANLLCVIELGFIFYNVANHTEKSVNRYNLYAS